MMNQIVFWFVTSLVVLVLSVLGMRAIIRRLPKAGVGGKILLILAMLVCCGAFAFGLGCGGCAGFFLVASMGKH